MEEGGSLCNGVRTFGWEGCFCLWWYNDLGLGKGVLFAAEVEMGRVFMYITVR
jgi:hypothetical protein